MARTIAAHGSAATVSSPSAYAWTCRTSAPASTDAGASRASSAGVRGIAGCSAGVRWPLSATSSRATRNRGSSSFAGQNGRPLGPAVLDLVAHRARNREQAFEVEVDPRSRLLRDLVLDREVEVVGAVVERAEGVLVLGQHRRPDVLDVVEEDPAQPDPAPVLPWRDLAAAERRPVRLVRPAEEREEAADLVLEVARPLQVLEPLVERLVEADHHRRRRVEAGLDDRALRLEVVGDEVLPLRVPRAEVLGEDLGTAAGDPVHARVAQTGRRLGVRDPGAVGEEHELRDGQRIELDPFAVALPHRSEQVAVVVQRQPRVEAAVERDQVAAEVDQLVDLGKDVLARQHVAAVLVRQDVEGAVVALGDGDPAHSTSMKELTEKTARPTPGSP